jgi:hypothetical protein
MRKTFTARRSAGDQGAGSCGTGVEEPLEPIQLGVATDHHA